MAELSDNLLLNELFSHVWTVLGLMGFLNRAPHLADRDQLSLDARDSLPYCKNERLALIPVAPIRVIDQPTRQA